MYTIGYEGRSVDAFFSRLLRLRLSGVIDVRSNPVSRKYGFAARSMTEIGKKLASTIVTSPNSAYRRVSARI